MRLQRIEVKKLYGTFSKSVRFDPSLNLLVGINGSGKTSVLNCIDWLLKPDLPKLASTKFHSIVLNFLHNGKNFQLLARHEGGRLIVSEETGQVGGGSVSVEVLRPHESIHSERDFTEACQMYGRLVPEPGERALWKFMHSLPRPLAISLDRTITAEIDEQVFIDEVGRMRAQKVKAKSPLEKVSDVTSARFAAYREKNSALNEMLKARIVSSAFNSPFAVNEAIKKEQVVSLEEINKLEAKVTSLLSAMDPESSAAKNVERYFRDVKQFVSHAQRNKELWVIFSAQFRQISELAVAFSDYEKKSSAAFEPIKSYLSDLNKFFRESGKQIGFNERDGRLSFQFVAAAGGVAGGHVAIDRLSSGEKQILILLTFLAFIASKNEVFVVDEPELSLHPRWQERFLDAILSQAPPGSQIILATHSPEIVSRHRDKCIVLDG